MLIGIGIDLVEISRIKKTFYKEGLLKRVFTPAEITNCRLKGVKQAESFAVRFAAKEAFLKAIGTGWGTKHSPLWKEIEVLTDKRGAPYIKLSGKARQIAHKQGIRKIHLSLTHTAQHAVAIVICES